ncbi:site-specific integrase [Bradyrhizobium sp. ERR14]|uniref:tyrosine-type recombinase/integrase n=1 Tax=Bradyrhizobium sp. ERR14 TaxID=2663837 RepID=UPI0017D70746|nr:site-specific integrase [Bradyrhizobium sp. ERR14]MBB4391830.1 integrase [Bradyrhizobium sp. ERR14]
MPAKKHRKELTTTMVARLKAPAAGRLWFADSVVPGFGVRVTEKGAKTFVLRTRYPGEASASRREIGKVGEIDLADARDKARAWLKLIGEGKDPARVEEEQRKAQLRKGATTVNAVLDAFEKDHVEGLRSGDQVKAAFTSHVRPRIGDRSIYDLKRSDITTMLNEIAAEIAAESRKAKGKRDGKVMADRVLAHVRKAFNWQMVQDDEFKSPIVRGMAKTKPKERARKRILADDEIRDVWKALEQIEQPACYPRYVKSLLLCMTRRNESARMHTSELEGHLWTIPGSRYKNKLDHVIPITPAILELIGEKPAGCKSNSWYVFSTTTSGGQLDGAKAFSGFSKAKKELDAIVSKIRKEAGRAPMKQWQLHDLRRTGRSLMSRAKVDADHAERCMGHVIGGVRETYDRYEYLDEMRKAFEALASTLDMILNPPVDNVVPMRAVAEVA